jgi:LysM repeat protein
MDNNDSNNKPQQTGGLKLMTVFIAVLALHVVVIGGFTVYHLMSGGSTDADVVSIDKTKKDVKPADGTAMASATATDATQPDKSATTTPSTTPTTEVATIPATPPVPDVTGPNEIVPPSPGPAPLLKPLESTTSLTLAPSDSPNGEKLTSLAPLTSELAPEAAPAQAAASVVAPSPATTPGPIEPQTPAPTSATPSGPVHMPPAEKAPSPTHVDGPTYTVRITDSYKKIATAHHITVAQLKAANHIKDDTLHAGQKLIIPAAKTMVASATPASSLAAKPVTSSLSESASVPTTTLAAAPVSKTTTAGSHEHLYTIVKGDTLVKIAHKFKTTKSAIIAENNLTDGAKLTIGKKLKIPSRESRSAGNSVPVAAPMAPQVQAPTQPVIQPQPQVEAKRPDVSAQLANFQGSTDF